MVLEVYVLIACAEEHAERTRLGERSRKGRSQPVSLRDERYGTCSAIPKRQA